MKNILWVLVVINILALVIFIGAYFYYGGRQNSRQDSQMEKSWVTVVALAGLLVIGLAAFPLQYGHSAGWTIFAGFFAILPLLIFAMIYIPGKVKSLKKEKTFAETYYKDRTQRKIAKAIENNDTALLKELIKGQDLNIQGTRVNDWDGLNYLQFAIHLRNCLKHSSFNKESNLAAIRILIANGSSATPALAEACMCLSADELLLLLNAGADPNTSCYIGGSPLLFQVIGNQQNDIAILLLRKGAAVNALDKNKFSPVMYAALNAKNNKEWHLVRYMLEEAHADYQYAKDDGLNLVTIIKDILKIAKNNEIEMPADFNEVVKWLKQKKVL